MFVLHSEAFFKGVAILSTFNQGFGGKHWLLNFEDCVVPLNELKDIDKRTKIGHIRLKCIKNNCAIWEIL